MEKTVEEIHSSEKHNYVTIPFGTGIDLTGLPIVTFKQGDKKFNFILDSGSVCCVVNSVILSEFEYKEYSKEYHVVGIGGEIVHVPSCQIALSYRNSIYEHQYAIRDLTQVFKTIKEDSGVNLHGILGTDFFTKFKYVLDFDELIAYSKQ